MFRTSRRPRIDDFVPFVVESRGVTLTIDRDNEHYSLRVTPDADSMSVMALTEAARGFDLEVLPEDECAPDVEEDGTVTFWMYDMSIEALRPDEPLVRKELEARDYVAPVIKLHDERRASVRALHDRVTAQMGDGYLAAALPVFALIAGLS